MHMVPVSLVSGRMKRATKNITTMISATGMTWVTGGIGPEYAYPPPRMSSRPIRGAEREQDTPMTKARVVARFPLRRAAGSPSQSLKPKIQS